METHSCIPVWEIPWTEEPGGLLSMGSQRVGHNLVAKQQQHTERTRKFLPVMLLLRYVWILP